MALSHDVSQIFNVKKISQPLFAWCLTALSAQIGYIVP